MPIVEAVAEVLQSKPELQGVEVAGHADERGTDQANVMLTTARARSVVAALTARGIDRDRLRPIGYGEYCPIDPASNAAAWEKNRRVEFKILKTAEGPTGVEVGCPRAVEKGITPPAP